MSSATLSIVSPGGTVSSRLVYFNNAAANDELLLPTSGVFPGWTADVVTAEPTLPVTIRAGKGGRINGEPAESLTVTGIHVTVIAIGRADFVLTHVANDHGTVPEVADILQRVQAISYAGNTMTGDCDLVVTGNLTVTGSTTTLGSHDVSVKDKNVVLGEGSTTDAQATGGGLTLRGATDKTIAWHASTSSGNPHAWSVSDDLEVAGSLVANRVVPRTGGAVEVAGDLQVSGSVSAGSLAYAASSDFNAYLSRKQNVSTLAAVMRRGGYLAGFVGKYHIGRALQPAECLPLVSGPNASLAQAEVASAKVA